MSREASCVPRGMNRVDQRYGNPTELRMSSWPGCDRSGKPWMATTRMAWRPMLGSKPLTSSLIGENEVEVRAVWRRADGLRQAGQAFVQMGEQAVCIQRLQNQPAAEPRLERVDRGPISAEHAVPHGIGAAARRTLRRQPVA